MSDSILRLYPLPAREEPLTGLYLREGLRDHAGAEGEAFVYTNFIASLDGRIAVLRPDGGMTVPEQIANPRDWRLFQELAVQADVLITSGRYLRDYGTGQAQEILRVYDDPQFADLRTWREEQGLPPLPDLAVVSRSLRFPIPPALVDGGRRVLVFTTGSADPERVRELERQLGEVIVAGESDVDGGRLVGALAERGYRLVYSTTGPKVMHMLVGARRLDRLYLTLAGRLLGGSPFSSIVEGTALDPPTDLRLRSLYYDPHAFDGVGQIFVSYERAGA